MLSEALAFPRADDDWLRTILIGAGLSLFGFLVLPAILVNGYLLRVVRAGVEGDDRPPRFEDWADLFVDGLLVFVIEIVYVTIPSIILGTVFAVVIGVGAIAGAAADDPAVWLGVGLLAVLPLLAILVVLLVAGYLLPGALANFARTGDIAAAFHLGTIARAAFSVEYLTAIILVIVVSAVLGFVGGLLVLVLVGFLVLFYLQVVVHHLFGRGFARGLDREPDADDRDSTAD